MSKQGVLNLEEEGADPKLSTIEKLAAALKVSPRDLLPMSWDGPSPADVRGVRNVADAAAEVYERLKPTIAKLKKLLGNDRSTYAPDLLSGYAQVLDRELVNLFKVLTDAGRADPGEESTPVDHPEEARREPPAGRRGQESTRVDRPKVPQPEQPREGGPDARKARKDKAFARDVQKHFRYLRQVYPDLAPREGESNPEWARRMRLAGLPKRHPALPGMLNHLLREFDPDGESPPGPPPAREPDPEQVVHSTSPGRYSGPAAAEAFARDCEPYLRTALDMADRHRALRCNVVIVMETDGVLEDVIPDHAGKSTTVDRQIATLRPLLEEVAEAFRPRHGKGKYTHPAHACDPREAFLPAVRRMFEVLGLEPSRLLGESPEGQKHMRASMYRRTGRMSERPAKKARR
jgi:hypothetical protein